MAGLERAETAVAKSILGAEVISDLGSSGSTDLNRARSLRVSGGGNPLALIDSSMDSFFKDGIVLFSQSNAKKPVRFT